MFLLVNVVSAQNLTADISITSDSDFLTDVTSFDSESEDFYEESEDVYYDVPVQAAEFNWRTKSFHIASGAVEYNTAELLDEVTNKTVKTVKLTDSNRKVDMIDVPSGSYYLILTNDSGQVHSEKIVII